MGFTESFISHFYCRFCKLPISELKHSCVAAIDNLRNPTNYDMDIETDDVKLTGIKEDSIWNIIPFFHVTRNWSCDVMHDILEGVLHYDLILILNNFINEKKLFTTEQLNFRIDKFNFGAKKLNKPPLLGFFKKE